MDKTELNKALRKIPRWLSHKNQINSQILFNYLELSIEGNFIEIEALEQACDHIKDFYGNFNQMCYPGKKNNAQIFEKQNGLVRLQPELRSFILDNYKHFLKENP